MHFDDIKMAPLGELHSAAAGGGWIGMAPLFFTLFAHLCGCYGTSKNRKDQLRRFFQTQVDILMVVCLRLLAAGKKHCLIYREVDMGEGQGVDRVNSMSNLI